MFSKILQSAMIGLLILPLISCQNSNSNKDNTTNFVILALLASPSKPNTVQNLKAESTTQKTVTLTWDDYPGAVVYNVYYTCSPSSQSTTVPADTTVTDPVVVSSPTGAVTVNGTTTGNETCSSTDINVFKKADKSPLTIPLKKLGIPYKFIVTAVTSGSTETVASSVAKLSEVIPTQAQRLRGIYMVGGLSSSYATSVSAVDLYDQDTNVWYSGITSLPTPVSFAGIGSEKSKLVVVGGFTATGNVSGLTQVYDILTDSWANRAVGNPSSRANLGVASMNGKLYFMGGTTGASATTAWAGSTLNDIYDVSTNIWSVGTAFGAAGSDRALTQINGVVYNHGGRTAAAAVATTHDGYIIAPIQGLTAGAEVALTVGRTGHSLVSYSSLTNGGDMWSIGGLSTITGNTGCGINVAGATVHTPITTVQSLQAPYEAVAVWAAGPTLPTATAFGGAVVDPRNGNVYYSGGNTSNVALTNTGVTTFLRSNIVTKVTWTTLTAMPNARWGHTAVIPIQ